MLDRFVGRRIDTLELDGVGITGQLVAGEQMLGFFSEPSNSGASPAHPNGEELMRLKFESARCEGADYEEVFVGATLAEVYVLHAAVIFGVPVEVPAGPLGESGIFGEVELPAGRSYGFEYCRPVPTEDDISFFNAAIATGMVNQVDLGVRLKFDDGSSWSVATDGCMIFHNSYQGDEENEFLEDVLQIPLSHRL